MKKLVLILLPIIFFASKDNSQNIISEQEKEIIVNELRSIMYQIISESCRVQDELIVKELNDKDDENKEHENEKKRRINEKLKLFENTDEEYK